MHRRTWLLGAASAGLAASLAGCATRPASSPAVPVTPASTAAGPPLAASAAPAPAAPLDAPEQSTLPRAQRPPRLKPGDLVGLFAPSNAASDAQLARGRANLEALGFRVRVPRNLMAVRGHLAGTVEQRVDDIHALWRDPEVKALWALRGGYGAALLLPHLDYGLLRREPKALIGFSDITALHLALQGRAGLVSFHGPWASSVFSPFTRDAMQAVLMQPQAQTRLLRAPEHRSRATTEPAYRARTLRAGTASGHLVGGNLSVLSALIGTPYAPAPQGALLFIEDVGETPSRIDRMLTQLQLALGLDRANGLLAGVFERCDPPRGEASLSLAQVMDDHLGRAGVPAVYGWSFGHVRDQLTLPLGVPAQIDTDSETLTLLEPAVD